MDTQETTQKLFPAAMVNITNKCTLRCRHCFVFREGNPVEQKNEMDSTTMLETLRFLQKKHYIHTMLWMGGEPLLRPDVLREGVTIFNKNHITTNGTIDLIDFPGCIYVISIDGPPEINDSIRGNGTFEKVMHTLSRVPKNFGSTVMCQCVVTKANEDYLEDLVELLMPTRLEGMTFSFYVPNRADRSDLTWGSLERRDKAVHEAIRLKDKYPDFIWNSYRTLELTRSENAPSITDRCPAKQFVLPLYLEGDHFVTPFCCYGNDADCHLCGAWIVFYLADKLKMGKTA